MPPPRVNPAREFLNVQFVVSRFPFQVEWRKLCNVCQFHICKVFTTAPIVKLVQRAGNHSVGEQHAHYCQEGNPQKDGKCLVCQFVGIVVRLDFWEKGARRCVDVPHAALHARATRHFISSTKVPHYSKSPSAASLRYASLVADEGDRRGSLCTVAEGATTTSHRTARPDLCQSRDCGSIGGCAPDRAFPKTKCGTRRWKSRVPLLPPPARNAPDSGHHPRLDATARPGHRSCHRDPRLSRAAHQCHDARLSLAPAFSALDSPLTLAAAAFAECATATRVTARGTVSEASARAAMPPAQRAAAASAHVPGPRRRVRRDHRWNAQCEPAVLRRHLVRRGGLPRQQHGRLWLHLLRVRGRAASLAAAAEAAAQPAAQPAAAVATAAPGLAAQRAAAALAAAAQPAAGCGRARGRARRFTATATASAPRSGATPRDGGPRRVARRRTRKRASCTPRATCRPARRRRPARPCRPRRRPRCRRRPWRPRRPCTPRPSRPVRRRCRPGGAPDDDSTTSDPSTCFQTTSPRPVRPMHSIRTATGRTMATAATTSRATHARHVLVKWHEGIVESMPKKHQLPLHQSGGYLSAHSMRVDPIRLLEATKMPMWESVCVLARSQRTRTRGTMWSRMPPSLATLWTIPVLARRLTTRRACAPLRGSTRTARLRAADPMP